MLDAINIFSIKPKFKGSIIVCNSHELGIYLEFSGVKHYRYFIINKDCIEIKDYGNHEFSYNHNNHKYVSDGYGILKYRTIHKIESNIILCHNEISDKYMISI